MPVYDMQCPVCDIEQADVFASIDEIITCPCGSPMERVWRAKASSVLGDEIDETHHDLDPDGGVIRFRSRQEKQRYLDAHGLQPFVRWAGEHDQHVSRWASMDAYTLAAAAALVSRASQATREPEIRCETMQFSITPVKPSEL